VRLPHLGHAARSSAGSSSTTGADVWRVFRARSATTVAARGQAGPSDEVVKVGCWPSLGCLSAVAVRFGRVVG
jgi:hypothetical protein